MPIARLIAVGVFAIIGVTAAAAQPRKANPSDDLRPAYATSADVAEGKRVADGLCARCHGAVGVSATIILVANASSPTRFCPTRLMALVKLTIFLLL
jgi:mono/diheme cytochrome c family protein